MKSISISTFGKSRAKPLLEKVATKGVTSLWEVTFVLILRIADKKAGLSPKGRPTGLTPEFLLLGKVEQKGCPPTEGSGFTRVLTSVQDGRTGR